MVILWFAFASHVASFAVMLFSQRSFRHVAKARSSFRFVRCNFSQARLCQDDHARRRVDRYRSLLKTIKTPSANVIHAGDQQFELPCRNDGLSVFESGQVVDEGLLRNMAGYLDGSSCISFIRRSNGPFKIATTNSYLRGDRLLQFLHVFGGAIYRIGDSTGLETANACWVSQGRKASDIARVLSPFCVARRRQLEIVSAWSAATKTERPALRKEFESFGRLSDIPMEFNSWEQLGGFCDARLCLSVDMNLRLSVVLVFRHRHFAQAVQSFMYSRGLPVGDVHSCGGAYRWLLAGRSDPYPFLRLLLPHVVEARPKIESVLATSDDRQARMELRKTLFHLNGNPSRLKRCEDPELWELNRLRHNARTSIHSVKDPEKRKEWVFKYEEYRLLFANHKMRHQADSMAACIREKLSNGSYVQS